MGLPTDAKAVLITGAGSGIGAATARHLAGRGFHVFAGFRKLSEDVLPDGFDTERITALALDVTNAAQIQAAVTTISELSDRKKFVFWGLVNNAGIDHHAPLELTTIDTLRTQLDVMAVGTLAVTQAFLPMLRESQGRIVNVGSINGRSVARGTGAYSAAKHALEAFSATLRLELAPWEIAVSVIEPGAVRTPMWDKAFATFEELPQRVRLEALELYYPDWQAALERGRGDMKRHLRTAVSAEAGARAIGRALTDRRPKRRYLVGWDARLFSILVRGLPARALDWVMRGVFNDQDMAGSRRE